MPHRVMDKVRVSGKVRASITKCMLDELSGI